MSELHKFLFDGLPVRGMVVRLTDAWVEILKRRRAADAAEVWPWPVSEMLGEMAAAGALMQANIKFNGALILQIFGEGPVKVAVAEVQQDLSLRVTAKVVGEVAADAHLQELVNVDGRGRCAITLDPKDKLPGQQAYQGVVPLNASHGPAQPRLADVIEHYMRQSEQLDTKLVLAARVEMRLKCSSCSSISIFCPPRLPSPSAGRRWISRPAATFSLAASTSLVSSCSDCRM